MSRPPKPNPAVRHIVSINDLTNQEIERIFEGAETFLEELPDAAFPYRIGRSTNVASNFILASLFYEPSTRTRLSFESAMLRLGGDIITSADPATSSAAKGESIADTVRVIANYADVIVIRHPRDGAARLAADYSPVPVINGGDGSHEHPTQTLCDLFTLKKKNKKLKNLNVAISGDLKGSRTIHSFVYALARFGATIWPMPAKGMELPEHVETRLREEFHCERKEHGAIDALYVTPDEPHQQSLFAGSELDVDLKVKLNEQTGDEKIDVVYVTRFQKERWAEKGQNYPTIDAQFLREPKYSKTSVLHPLPRVGELDISLDTDRRAVYFQQAAYGVPIRMALISMLLGAQRNKSLQRFEGGFGQAEHLVYERTRGTGIQCLNKNCIVHDPLEGQYTRDRFYIIANQKADHCKLRCIYCETDIDSFVVADKKKGHYTLDTSPLLKTTQEKTKDLVIYKDEAQAIADGLRLKENHTPAKRSAG